MGFWKKIKMLVPLKHVVFVLVLMAAMLAIAFYDSAEDIKVTIEPESVTIKATGYTMNIPYEMIESMELADMPKARMILLCATAIGKMKHGVSISFAPTWMQQNVLLHIWMMAECSYSAARAIRKRKRFSKTSSLMWESKQ